MLVFMNVKRFIKIFAGCFTLLFMGCHSSWAGIQVPAWMKFPSRER